MALKANGKRASSAQPRKLVVSIRMMDSEQQALAEAAAAHGVSVACLARVLTSFGIAQLARGNKELERAVKTSRDA